MLIFRLEREVKEVILFCIEVGGKDVFFEVMLEV